MANLSNMGALFKPLIEKAMAEADKAGAKKKAEVKMKIKTKVKVKRG
jgi:hypothetical protein